MAKTTMNVMDTINGAEGECYVTIDGKRDLFMHLVNLKADSKKSS